MKIAVFVSVFAVAALACDNCYGPRDDAVHVRNVRRMQPEAQSATVKPRAPLEWGQLNFLHTTDTHGWLEGHLKEQNYGADWGDFVSFTSHMKHQATRLGVDLLLIDTGDLHDGAGLSDNTDPNGLVANPIFENVQYDLLSIGNHELYITDIAYETFNGFSKVYGERYLTSNVQVLNPATGAFEYIGNQYRYFTTRHGLRIMSFGVLFDFTGNSNVSKVIKTADLVKESWFLDAINYEKPIDLFVVIGHNPVRTTAQTSTFGLLYETIRGIRPDVPIQTFGGHTHVRDFTIYDEISTGLESGRYCETLGWLSMSGIKSSSFRGKMKPRGVPNPTRKAIKADSPSRITESSLSATNATNSLTGASSSPGVNYQVLNQPSASDGTGGSKYANSTIVYSRRYLDWNRLTFAYHASGSQDRTFENHRGISVTHEITSARKTLNLTTLYGCAPKTYCQYCKPYGADGNIFGLLETALGLTVINQERASIPRIIIINTGSIRFDLVEGPFTLDDSFIVSPFADAFQFIPDVPYDIASRVLTILNSGPHAKRRDLSTQDFGFAPLTGDACPDGTIPHEHDALKPRSIPLTRGLHRRQGTATTPGYTTTDDFGTDGDDTPHSKIPNYPQPNCIQSKVSFPADGAEPKTVDLIFLDFLAKNFVIPALQRLGTKYTVENVQEYLPVTFTTNSYLPAYAKLAWQKEVPNCPVGRGVGA